MLVESIKVHYSYAMATIEEFVNDIPFLSFQQRRMLREEAMDLALWGLPGLEDISSVWPSEYDRSSKNEVRKIFSAVMARLAEIRRSPIDYSTFNPSYDFRGRKPDINTDFLSPDKIMGRCPCPRDGEQTRCCNLKTDLTVGIFHRSPPHAEACPASSSPAGCIRSQTPQWL